MFSDYVHHAINLYEKADAILICDGKGYIEYSKWRDDSFFLPAEVIGMHILELYPELTEETSTILQVLKSGKPRISDEQSITNYKGQSIHIISTTVPITVNNKIIGVLCASVYCGKDRDASNMNNKKDSLYSLDDIITQDEKMLELKQRVKNVAVNNSTVLIFGETGTGKELVAQSIHTSSLRWDKPFISQNCAAIPVNLLESIFFGTEKGSFTGAESKKGLFEIADGGTLFLDEINSMDMSIQAKLLKVLEEKKVRRIGGHRDISFDVRIICAMNENPFDALKACKIREDLYYRIGVVQMMLVPLRERPKDIMLLADHYIDYYNKEMSMQVTGVSELVKNVFETYRWRGNVRELRNTIESAFNIVKNNTITINDIPDIITKNKEKDLFRSIPDIYERLSLQEAVDSYEKQIISKVLGDSENLAAAARRLDISRQSLKYKLEKYGLKLKFE